LFPDSFTHISILIDTNVKVFVKTRCENHVTGCPICNGGCLTSIKAAEAWHSSFSSTVNILYGIPLTIVTSSGLLLRVVASPWRWSQEGPPKRCYPTTTLHGLNLHRRKSLKSRTEESVNRTVNFNWIKVKDSRGFVCLELLHMYGLECPNLTWTWRRLRFDLRLWREMEMTSPGSMPLHLETQQVGHYEIVASLYPTFC
jgi:hypothetical protein